MIIPAENIIFEIKGQTAYITLNRPQAFNGINLPLAKELMAATIHCDEDPKIRAVVLTGAGNAFCAGGDLRDFSEKGDQLPAALKELTVYVHASVSRLARMQKPLITAVNGVAAGAGMSYAIAGDLIIAAESAIVRCRLYRSGSLPRRRYDLCPSKDDRIGASQGNDSDQQAGKSTGSLELGIGQPVRPGQGADAGGRITGKHICRRPDQILWQSEGTSRKFLLRDAGDADGELEARGISDMAKTEDGKEGVASFVQKRKPLFKGL